MQGLFLERPHDRVNNIANRGVCCPLYVFFNQQEELSRPRNDNALELESVQTSLNAMTSSPS